MGGRGLWLRLFATGPERLAAAAGRSGDGRAGAERGLRGGRAADMTAPPEGGQERAPGTGKLQLGGWRGLPLGSGSGSGRPEFQQCRGQSLFPPPWIQIGSFFLLEWIDCLRIP